MHWNHLIITRGQRYFFFFSGPRKWICICQSFGRTSDTCKPPPPPPHPCLRFLGWFCAANVSWMQSRAWRKQNKTQARTHVHARTPNTKHSDVGEGRESHSGANFSGFILTLSLKLQIFRSDWFPLSLTWPPEEACALLSSLVSSLEPWRSNNKTRKQR